MRKPSISTEDLLNLILEAFADIGFEGTSVRELCRHLKVSHNLLHERFGAKDDIWYAAIDHGFAYLATEFSKALEHPACGTVPIPAALRTLIAQVGTSLTAATPTHVAIAEPTPTTSDTNELEAIRRLILAWIRASATRPSLLRVIQQEAARPGPRFDYIFNKYILPMQAAVDAWISDLQQRGLVRPGAAVSLVWYFLVTHGVGCMAGLPSLSSRIAKNVSTDEIAELAADMLLAGMAPLTP